MNKNCLIYTALLASFLFSACKMTERTANKSLADSDSVNLDTIIVTPGPDRERYNPARTREHDLLHTKLDVSFDWEKQRLPGKAHLTFTPYFYPNSTVELDAKGFDLHKVALVKKDSLILLDYEYDSLKLHIKLDTLYTRSDTFEIFIDYTAKPNEFKSGGSSAITSDKGLYFINPLGEEENKPKQIWTQGETESNSRWFPTIDAPNERMTQELYITVDEKYTTLSNGLLVFQTENENGTRTDYWKQDLPHAPYLVMMAIGEYAVVEDKWRDIAVNYYVEPEYEQDAKNIFAHTPEMLEFFSKLLGVDYPWEKYHQVVVRDYVSGAMENTGAVIFGEFVQKNARELIDGGNEDIVAHELFHHWFGDLVTCESWANLPLNESFATYGEYLWREHKNGRESADHTLQNDLRNYLRESKSKQENMIRFNYEDKEHMFDSHSYAKGGRILHMLRKYVGDEAFFESLKLYLEQNKYTAVEIHQLRLAFEEVTGEDLNWFFNQWFLSSGHPVLEINYNYNDSLGKQQVIIAQQQDFAHTPVYRLPIEIDLYFKDGNTVRHQVVLENKLDTFTFNVPAQPVLVNTDAEKMLLCVKKDQKELSQWKHQYYHAPLYLDRYEAVEHCAEGIKEDSLLNQVLIDALKDPYWNIRKTAIENISYIDEIHRGEVKSQLIKLAGTDEKTAVRARAISALLKNYKEDKDLLPVYRAAVNDSSYSVMSRGLAAVSEMDIDLGMKMAGELENEGSNSVLTTIAKIYSTGGSEVNNDFFLNKAGEIRGYNKIAFVSYYEKFLLNREISDPVILKGLDIFADVAGGKSSWWIKIYGIEAIRGVMDKYQKEEMVLLASIKELEKPVETEDPSISEKNKAKTAEMKGRLEIVKSQQEEIKQLLLQLKEQETNERLINVYGELE